MIMEISAEEKAAFKKQPPDMFYIKKGVLKSFANSLKNTAVPDPSF